MRRPADERTPQNARELLARGLADGLAAALAAGDAKAARVALVALQSLAGDLESGPGAAVVDLAAERGKRGAS